MRTWVGVSRGRGCARVGVGLVHTRAWGQCTHRHVWLGASTSMWGLVRAQTCVSWCEHGHAWLSASMGMSCLVQAWARVAWCEHRYVALGASAGMYNPVRVRPVACAQCVHDLEHTGSSASAGMQGLVRARACATWCVCNLLHTPSVYMTWCMNGLVHA